jgi:hypothetical protein
MTVEPRRDDSDRHKSGRRVIGATGGDILGAVTAVRDRFIPGPQDAGGRFSLVEHLMPPRTLAAPLHRRSREDDDSDFSSGKRPDAIA